MAEADGEEADASTNRDVYGYLVSASACRALLDLFVHRESPEAAAAADDALRDQGGRGGAAPASRARVFDPLVVLTWNISECDEAQRISAQAPADRSVWGSADNFLAVQQEILRYRPSLVSLQECPSLEPLPSLLGLYRFVGAAAAHAGFVHLYILRSLSLPVRVELAGQPVVACRLDVGDVALVFVALHLPPYEEGAAERTLVLRKVVAAV